MCEIKALNKISEVGYLSGTIVKAVWLGYPILKKKKKSLVIKAISQKHCEICGGKMSCNNKK